jgi:hypothetical protein
LGDGEHGQQIFEEERQAKRGRISSRSGREGKQRGRASHFSLKSTWFQTVSHYRAISMVLERSYSTMLMVSKLAAKPIALILMMNRTGPSTSSKQDYIQKNLNAIGAYTHLNNLQLLPTGVEEARYGKASKVGFYCWVYDLMPITYINSETAKIWAKTRISSRCGTT